MKSLANIVRSAMVGKYQIAGSLKSGNNFCISGLLINHFAPDIDIEGQSWLGITELVNRYPKYFSEEHYSSHYADGIRGYIHDFKQYYKDTGRINLSLLVKINDQSFSNFKAFTFADFANLFEEIGIKIEELEPTTKYKEDEVLTVDNIKVTEEPIVNLTSQPIINIQLDPTISHLISQQISKMLIKKENEM